MIFELHMLDNDSWMVGSCDELDPKAGCPFCPVCGFRTDQQYTAPSFILRKKKYDVSCCYDGAVIVSQRFRRLCAKFDTRGIEFIPLPNAPGFFHLKCVEPVRMNYRAMGTEFLRKCRACGFYRDVIVVTQPTLAPGETVSTRAIRFGDKYFGSNNEAIPMILVGEELFDAMEKARFIGIDSVSTVRTTPARTKLKTHHKSGQAKKRAKHRSLPKAGR
jgi:hypothetical protein